MFNKLCKYKNSSCRSINDFSIFKFVILVRGRSGYYYVHMYSIMYILYIIDNTFNIKINKIRFTQNVSICFNVDLVREFLYFK